jgi:hypothetical protein
MGAKPERKNKRSTPDKQKQTTREQHTRQVNSHTMDDNTESRIDTQRVSTNFIGATILLAICGSAYFASPLAPFHDGRGAIWLNAIQSLLFAIYLLRTRDRRVAALLVFGAVFGIVELVADFLCVRFTGTLDYSPAKSSMLWESPWWMPIAWMLVAAQVGFVGANLVERIGLWRGATLCAIVGAVNIPFYEEMAFHAGWWRYVNCVRILHTPLYIVAAELIIGFALAPAAFLALRSGSFRRAAALGALAGLSTIVGGIVGYGIVEVIGNGARPLKWASPLRGLSE